jgi:hypothetical protein
LSLCAGKKKSPPATTPNGLKKETMENTYHTETIQGKPGIVEIIAERVELRKSGKEYVGLCPLHSENTPSFTVSEEKQVFYCHGCHVGGDVIDFIRKIDSVSFRDALSRLGIDGGSYRPKPIDTRKRRAAATLARWLNRQHLLVGAILRQLSREIAIAEEAGATLLKEQWSREFTLLESLFDSLQEPDCAAELWAVRDSIEAITAHAPVEGMPEFPPWTPEYATYLTAHLPAREVA